ncbi:hypothetical protein [uncultured Prevotella sp.]|jgi:hypothetical protein|uniref:hypothetical protein n=1 Tax=uncultured Prevotella sp. TaxID=159272 RepID=UPI0025D89705|nr:hypothetical protein [uncultured Prevotella sp.]
MSETKTYVFGNDGQCGGGMMSLLAPLLQRNGLDPNLLLAMNKNGNGWGDGSGFMWVIFLFFLMGWGGNGWGGFGGNGRGAIANEINNDYGRSLLMDAIGGNRNAISNLATQLNCTEGQIQSAISALTSQVQSVGNQVGMTGMQTINALQQGNMQIAQQIADCCCKTNNAITAMDGNVKLAMCQQTGALTNSINNVAVGQERGFANVAYETQRQTCDLQNAIKDSTQTIVNGQQQAVMRELQNKIDSLREENSTFKSSAMTSQIVGQALAPVNAVLAGLQKEVGEIKCAQPNTVTVPYQPFVTVPNCVAAQYGLYANANANGFWG